MLFGGVSGSVSPTVKLPFNGPVGGTGDATFCEGSGGRTGSAAGGWKEGCNGCVGLIG